MFNDVAPERREGVETQDGLLDELGVKRAEGEKAKETSAVAIAIAIAIAVTAILRAMYRSTSKCYPVTLLPYPQRCSKKQHTPYF